MFIINPVEISNQLKKNGGFVPGIRAGKNTSEYISRVLKYITAFGAVFLAAIAILPVLLQGVMPFSITFGGTSVLIVVSVALEVLKNEDREEFFDHYPWLNDPDFLYAWQELAKYRNKHRQEGWFLAMSVHLNSSLS